MEREKAPYLTGKPGISRNITNDLDAILARKLSRLNTLTPAAGKHLP